MGGSSGEEEEDVDDEVGNDINYNALTDFPKFSLDL